MNIYYLTIIPAIIAIIYSAFIIFWLKKQPDGDEKMKEISSAIRIGSRAFLNRQYKTVAVVAAIISIALYFVFGWLSVIGFLAALSLRQPPAYIGMNIAIRSNSKPPKPPRKDCRRLFLWLSKPARLPDSWSWPWLY